jgi:fatty-acyl-CoA synthase
MQNCPQLVLAHFAILRANAVVVPVNPMNRAEELKHYITDPQALVAITTADLAPELAKASNALASAQRLRHMLVTEFTEALMPMLRVPTHRLRPGTIGCAPPWTAGAGGRRGAWLAAGLGLHRPCARLAGGPR